MKPKLRKRLLFSTHPPKGVSKLLGKAQLQGPDKFKPLRITLLTIFALVVLGYFFYQTQADVIVVDSFTVPKAFSEAGLSTEVLTKKVAERLLELETSTETLTTKDAISSTGETAPVITEVEISGAKIDPRGLSLFLRTLFHRNTKHIGGDVVQGTNYLDQAAASPVNGNRFFLSAYLNDGERNRSTRETVEITDSEQLPQDLAEMALQEVNPYLLAMYFRQQKRQSEALSLVERISNDYTNKLKSRAAAYNLWGIMLAEQGQDGQAIEKYQRAIELDPKYSFAYVNWGLTLQKEHDFQGAIKMYQRATELDPHNARAFDGWSSVLDIQGRFFESTFKARRAIEIDSDDAYAYAIWADDLHQSSRDEEATQKVITAIKLKPDSPDPYCTWGEILVSQHKYTEGIEKYKRGIEIDPQNACAYYKWGGALEQQGINDEAEKKFQTAISLRPQFAAAYYELGQLLLNEKRYSEAIDKLQRAEDIAPKISSDRLALAVKLRDEKKAP